MTVWKQNGRPIQRQIKHSKSHFVGSNKLRLLLINASSHSWRTLMKPHLPTDFSAYPNRGPQRVSGLFPAHIFMGGHVCQQGDAFGQNS
jgi:hypothetical protein